MVLQNMRPYSRKAYKKILGNFLPSSKMQTPSRGILHVLLHYNQNILQFIAYYITSYYITDIHSDHESPRIN